MGKTSTIVFMSFVLALMIVGCFTHGQVGPIKIALGFVYGIAITFGSVLLLSVIFDRPLGR